MKSLVFAFVIAAASLAGAATKTYQVTGPVVEVNDSKIVVEKGKERWELERTPNTKIGDVKVGDKVTVEYAMIAEKVDVKSGGKKEKKK